MTLRALFASCMLGLVAFAAANDYDLVVPRGWDYLKTAKTLVVYSPNGAFKPGDHISRVVPGGADGQGIRVSAGWPSATSVELAKAGSVNGFSGSIILSSDGTGANGLAAVIVPAGQGASRAPDDGITHAFPWVWILVAAGVVVVLAAGATLFRKTTVPGAPVRFTGRKGIEEGVREIRAKIDEIQEEQKQLVRKPPVLRSFRKQIDGFEHRLRDIESSTEQTQQQLATVATLIGKLDERLNDIAQHSVTASNESKKAIEAISKLSSDQTKSNQGLEDRIQKLASGQESLNAISRDVSKAIDSVANVAHRIDGLAAQNLSHENKLQATITGIEATRKDVETSRKDLDAKLKSSTDAAEATRKNLSELASALQATDKKLAGLEGQALNGAQRDTELKASVGEVAKSAEFLEKGLLRLDARVDELAKSNEALHHNLQKSAEALQLNLQEISGRVSTTEGSLHANLKGLASELGTLRNEVGSLPVAMSNLGDRVGSLDARLAPISERGDKLAEGFLGLQSRFEDAALGLAKQVHALESRLEEIKSEGSKLANLPEVVHGNTTELAAHVRSAETGLKALGEELAKLQDALLSDNKQSDAVAKEITQRLEAWESSLANVASKVEDLRAPEPDNKQSEAVTKEFTQRLEAWESSLANVASKVEDLRTPAEDEEDDDEEEVAVRPSSKKSKKAAAKEARRKAREAEEQAARDAAEAAEKAKQASQEVKKEAVKDEPKAEPKPVAKPQAPSAPELRVIENERGEIEVVTVEAPVLKVEEAEKPKPQSAASAKAEAQPAIEEPDFDDDEPEGLILERSKVGRWTELGGSSERLWSVKLPGGKPLPEVKGPIRPLTPIETPSIDSALGAIICTGQGAAYAQGTTLNCFWPGTETKSVALQSPMPNDLWRLMLFGGYIYCAEERQVEIIHTSTWTKHAFFTGDYLNQAHTENHWVGLMAWGDQLAVDFRDTLGNHVNSPREVDASVSEQSYFAASGNSAFVGVRSGSIFRVDPAGAVRLTRKSEEDRLLSLTITKAGLLAMIHGSNGVAARLISREGHLLKEANLGCQVMAHAPVVMADRMYIFDDSQSELLTVSLKNLHVLSRTALNSTLGANRMVGLACGKSHYLAIMGADDRGVSTRAFVLDVKTGQEMTLCPINHPRSEMVAGEGHLVVATSSAYQNTIQVFNPFEAVDLKQKKAA